jgi:Fur family ferric uptake transcriptional regulator
MSCETETATTLKDAGQKVTPQRMLILSTVRHARGHVTASEILDDVRRSYPYVDASTVYRTLAAARELRLVTETNMGAGDNQFEWTGRERHHHLICRECGAVTRLDNSYLDGLAATVLEDHGFQAFLDHFAIFGLCGGCRGGGA